MKHFEFKLHFVYGCIHENGFWIRLKSGKGYSFTLKSVQQSFSIRMGIIKPTSFLWWRIIKLKPTNLFKTPENSEYVKKKEACKWMINHYSNQYKGLGILISKSDMNILNEINQEYIDHYQQELLSLEAQKILGSIK